MSAERDANPGFRSVRFFCRTTSSDSLLVSEWIRHDETARVRLLTAEGSQQTAVVLDPQQALELGRRLIQWAETRAVPTQRLWVEE